MRNLTRYECFVVDDVKTLRTCHAIRRIVFGHEFKSISVIKTYNPAAVDELDKRSVMIACRDRLTGKIIGATRLTSGQYASDFAEFRRIYKLGKFPTNLLDEVVITSRYAILKPYRRKAVKLALLKKAYEYSLARNYTINVLVAESESMSFLRSLGFKPLDNSNTATAAGHRVPMYQVLHDYRLMSKCHSPLLAIARKQGMPERISGMNWQQHILPKPNEHQSKFAAIQDLSQRSDECLLLRGLSDVTRQWMMKNSITINCRKGEKIANYGAGDRYIGYVKRGDVDVVVHGVTVHTVRAGEVFGEISYILDVARNADLVARHSTDIILFNYSCVNNLTHEDAFQFWNNMSQLLAAKLLNMNYKFRMAYDVKFNAVNNVQSIADHVH